MAAAASTSAGVNNISATFGGSASPASSSAPLSSAFPSVSWNPQLKLPSSLRTSLVRLYGSPGPKRSPFTASLFRSLPLVSASISVGHTLPDATLSYIDLQGDLQTVQVSALTTRKKVVLFAVPGAFTPTCTQKHLPSFLEKADEMKAKGVDAIACIAVNDAFVMRAWGESLGVGDKLLLLSDGNGHFTRSMGVTLDLSDKPVGLGVRSRRYSLLAEDGVVKVLHLEDGGFFSISGAEDILQAL